MEFYTNFLRRGDKIYVRGYRNGKRFHERVPYSPTLYIPTNKPSNFKTVKGIPVEPVKQGTISDAKEFIAKYGDIQNFEIYGSNKYEYCFINEQYPKVDYDVNLIRVANIDIEVGSESGFPDPADVAEPITAITIYFKGVYWVLGIGEYKQHREDVRYIRCNNENDLLLKFLDMWQKMDVDIITGWNTQFFDIPYLYRRIEKKFDERMAKKLSPWGQVEERIVRLMNRQNYAYVLCGIVSLDYLEMYKKFTYTQQESYRLDNIAFVELGEKKIDYSEYNSLHQLYKEDYQKFIEYNIKDVELVQKLDDKLKLIELALALAYDAKVNLNDVMTQVRMWDTIIHNHLLSKNVVVPQMEDRDKDGQIEGAYVKEPQVGMHDWVVSFDLNSLYPHLMMQYNISPDTLVEGKHIDTSVNKLLTEQYPNETEYCLAANGHYFRKDFQGFLPELMQKMYNDRVFYKKEMINAQKELESKKGTADEKEKIRLRNSISKYHNIQMAKKISLNSAYGAIGNKYFRFFDVKLGEAITISGQLSIRWIEKKVNQYMNKLLGTDEDYVIAIDTDSIYVRMDELVKKFNPKSPVDFLNTVCEERFEKFITESYEELANYMGAYQNKMVMAREVIADKGIWTAKKRYILNVHDSEGVRYNEPKLKMMGIEAVKSSTPYACREMIKEALQLIMEGDESLLHQFVTDSREKFKKMPFEDVAFPRGVKGLAKYADSSDIYSSGTPIHVRGALLFNHLLDKKGLTKKYQPIQEGEKIKFCYLKTPNSIGENVISILSNMPEELDLNKYIDYDTQFEKSFLEPLKVITSKIGWDVEKQSTLESFF